MKIGLDIMGGDYAPNATVLGAAAAQEALDPDQTLVLIGHKESARDILQQHNFDPGHFCYVHTDEAIGMEEHPTRAIVKKPQSSMSIGLSLLKDGEIDIFCSAGNTGAMVIGSMLSVGSIPGVIRPVITSTVPKLNQGVGVLLDVGANADCKPEHLLQFGLVGSLMAQYMYNITDPKVALVNIGAEEEKGNLLCLSTYPLMKKTTLFNFVGNIEGRDLFNDQADVFVCDGFTGNIMLKLLEHFYVITLKKGYKNSFFDAFNYEQYGGSPILGLNAPVIVGHGISSPKAIKNMILRSRDMVKVRLIDKIMQAFD